MNKKTFKRIQKNVDDVIRTQKMDGNWNYSSYMQGLLNGMMLIESIVFLKEYRPYDRPKKWKRKSRIRQFFDRIFLVSGSPYREKMI